MGGSFACVVDLSCCALLQGKSPDLARLFRSCAVRLSHACSPRCCLQQGCCFASEQIRLARCVLFWDLQKSGSFHSKVLVGHHSGFHFSSPCFMCQRSILNQTGLNSCFVPRVPRRWIQPGLIAPESKVLCFLASTCEEPVNLHLVSEGNGKQLCS